MLVLQGQLRFSTALYFLTRYMPIGALIVPLALSTTTPQGFLIACVKRAYSHTYIYQFVLHMHYPHLKLKLPSSVAPSTNLHGL